MSAIIRDIAQDASTTYDIFLERKRGQRDLPEWKALAIDLRNNRLGFREHREQPRWEPGEDDLIVPLKTSKNYLVGTVRLGTGEIFSCSFKGGVLPGCATWRRVDTRATDPDDTEAYIQEDCCRRPPDGDDSR